MRLDDRSAWWAWTAAVCLLLAGCSPAPTIRLSDGTALAVPDAEGRWIVVNYFAEWCAPCRHEIPELNALASANRERLVVLGVNFDAPEEAELVAQSERLGVQFPVLRADPAAVLGIARPTVLPVTILVAPDGTTSTQEGPQTLAGLEAMMGFVGGR